MAGENDKWEIYQDKRGNMWFGTVNGVSVYNGSDWDTLAKKDGLVDNRVYSMMIDSEKKFWFGTEGGISRFDGDSWISFTKKEGLVENLVRAMVEMEDGSLWFGTWEGLTRYRRSKTPPRVHIVSVTTDQTYSDLSAIPAFVPGTRVTIEYNAVDFKTLPDKRQYRCRRKL